VADILSIAIVVAFFVLTALFVSGCARIVGRDLAARPVDDAGEPER